jgi:hypothetical protein
MLMLQLHRPMRRIKNTNVVRIASTPSVRFDPCCTIHDANSNVERVVNRSHAGRRWMWRELEHEMEEADALHQQQQARLHHGQALPSAGDLHAEDCNAREPRRSMDRNRITIIRMIHINIITLKRMHTHMQTVRITILTHTLTTESITNIRRHSS